MQLARAVHPHDQLHGDIGGPAGTADDHGAGNLLENIQSVRALDGDPALEIGDDLSSPHDRNVRLGQQ